MGTVITNQVCARDIMWAARDKNKKNKKKTVEEVKARD